MTDELVIEIEPDVKKVDQYNQTVVAVHIPLVNIVARFPEQFCHFGFNGKELAQVAVEVNRLGSGHITIHGIYYPTDEHDDTVRSIVNREEDTVLIEGRSFEPTDEDILVVWGKEDDAE